MQARRTASGLGLAALAAAGCAGGAQPPPAVLADGSQARPPPVELEGVESPTVATRARVLRPSAIDTGSTVARCDGPRNALVIQRVGVSGTSVTYLGPERRAMYGCDGTAHGRTTRTAWCGHAYTRLRAGRLLDPRLSLTCLSTDDEPLGFGWLQSAADASYVVVARAGYNEVYAVARELPVRAVTDDVDLGAASATFSVSEHARDGQRLREYVVEARVSG